MGIAVNVTVQLYTDSSREAFVYADENVFVCILPQVATQAQIDARMAMLGFKRRGRWVKCLWGFEAEFERATSAKD